MVTEATLSFPPPAPCGGNKHTVVRPRRQKSLMSKHGLKDIALNRFICQTLDYGALVLCKDPQERGARSGSKSKLFARIGVSQIFKQCAEPE